MALADTEIKKAIDSNIWTARRDGARIGSDTLQIGPNSVDLSVGPQLLQIAPKGACIDLHDPDSFSALKCHCAGRFVLQPGQLYLAASRESFDTSAPLWIPSRYRTRGNKTVSEQEVETHFVQHIEGRSTAARVGLSSHANAGFGDFGFGSGGEQWVFELQVVFPTRIYAGDRIAQVAFIALSGSVEAPYSGAYGGQVGPVAARLGVGRFQG